LRKPYRRVLRSRQPGPKHKVPGLGWPSERAIAELAKEAGLPVIKFHAARHTAATLALEAGVDIKIVSEQLGHSTTRITQDLYQHVRHQVHADSAEKVVDLLPRSKEERGTRS
jgi:integrase